MKVSVKGSAVSRAFILCALLFVCLIFTMCKKLEKEKETETLNEINSLPVENQHGELQEEKDAEVFIKFPSNFNPHQFLEGEWFTNGYDVIRFGEDSRYFKGQPDTRDGVSGAWKASYKNPSDFIDVSLDIQWYDHSSGRIDRWNEPMQVRAVSQDIIKINNLGNYYFRVETELKKIIDSDDADELKRYIRAGKDVRARIRDYKNPLEYAVRNEKINALAVLLEQDFDVNERLRDGQTLLDFTILPNRWNDSINWDNYRNITKIKIRRLLSEHGAYCSKDDWQKIVDETIYLNKILIGHYDEVHAAAFSSDSEKVVSGGYDKTIKIWEVHSGRAIRTIRAASSVLSVAFSPCGRYILCASNDKLIKLWDADTGEEIREFQGHSYTVSCAVFTPDGRQIISGSDDNTVKIWDAASGREIKTLEHQNSVKSVAVSSDGKLLVTNSIGRRSGNIKLWDISTGNEIRSFSYSHDYISVAISPDSKYISVGSHSRDVSIWEPDTGREIKIPEVSDEVSAVAFSHDSKFLLIASIDGYLTLWDLYKNEIVRKFRSASSIISAVQFSPCGKYFLSAAWDQKVYIWDMPVFRSR